MNTVCGICRARMMFICRGCSGLTKCLMHTRSPILTAWTRASPRFWVAEYWILMIYYMRLVENWKILDGNFMFIVRLVWRWTSFWNTPCPLLGQGGHVGIYVSWHWAVGIVKKACEGENGSDSEVVKKQISKDKRQITEAENTNQNGE